MCVLQSVIGNKILRCGYKPWSLIGSLTEGGIAQASTRPKVSHPLFLTVDLSSIISTTTFRHLKWSWETSVDPVSTTALNYEFTYSFVNGKWARESSVDKLLRMEPSPPLDLTLKCVPTASSSTQLKLPAISENKPASKTENKPLPKEENSGVSQQATVPIKKTPSTDSTMKKSLHHISESESESSIFVSDSEEKQKVTKSSPTKKLSGCQKRKKNKAKVSTGSAKGAAPLVSSEKKTNKLILGVVRISSRTNDAPPPIRVAKRGNGSCTNDAPPTIRIAKRGNATRK